MGYARPRPKRLAEKLLKIRRKLGLSQPQLAKRLGVHAYSDLSKYELNKNELPLGILLAYARETGCPVENLIDDGLDLPG